VECTEQEFSSGDDGGMLIEGKKPEILTLLKEEHAQKVEVQNEPRTTHSLNIQDEECSHTRWEATEDLRDDNYLTFRQMSISTEGLAEPIHLVAAGSANNNYVGTEWIMDNGLKVIVRQGDLVDVEADVIVNPANSELCHGGRAARAISVAAGKELDEKCYEYIRQFGDIKVGNAIQSTAGNLPPRIKHVIHAVGPKAHENGERQFNLDLVQRTVLCSLELVEHVLNATSIALPAISAGLFGVPNIDVAEALYMAILKFDESEPKCVNTVKLVNIDKGVTDLINKMFARRFGGVTECVSTECRTILPNTQCNNLMTYVNDDLVAIRGYFPCATPQKEVGVHS